jgi:hypothetical protein
MGELTAGCRHMKFFIRMRSDDENHVILKGTAFVFE